MRRVAWSVGLLALTLAPGAFAQAPAATATWPTPATTASAAATAPAAAPAPAPAPAPANASAAATPTTAPAGVAVIALPGATDAAWPLAQAVYSTPSLRPAGVDEAHARVLCGDPAPAAAPSELRDLADTVGAVHGDDAPSRAMLGNIAHRFGVKALVVVRVDAGHPSARAFLPDSGTFDAASYAPDDGPTIAWSAAARSLARTYGVEPATASAPAPSSPATSAPVLAMHDEPRLDNGPPKPRAFWQSGWFWGAVGAAAFAAGAIYFATRDNGPTTIHLEMQVPH